ncbi:MAG: hypothetical protein UV59_C0032G0016 [Candidatus Gottesmanbacteria bacterium GW2011_GWA1_43_11]|uniref:Uncharacterized protein n=1 Tax=Candidatus Gottesmanbacteria bacterium GW2011_GWA1_43_11 TaxID=1618436 RepID=A0A0G1FA91_9BACT|nr:MAG: hypothetical protein UV59_C0032G0016 [Candidatus Gottesmanbacteria bacterium GW2011_GWA1_43_11]
MILKHNMSKLFIKTGILLALFLLVVTPLHGQGKSNQAPGQQKKEAQKAVEQKVTIGSLDTVTENSVIIENKKNKQKTEALIDKTTKVIGANNKPVKLGTLKLKDLIALISSDSAVATRGAKLKVKKIFVKEASSSAQLKRRAVMGVITNIQGNTLTLTHQIQRDRTYIVIVSEQTIIHQKASEASGSATLASLSVGMRIAAVGDLNEGGGIIAKRIHIIPGKATGVFNKNPLATPSASLIASPSAIATPSALPSISPSSSPDESPVAL